MVDYQYVTSAHQYRDVATGQFVSRDTIQDYIVRITAAGQDASATLSTAVTDKRISPADFGLQMRAELKASYLQQSLLGRGGRDQMTPRDYGSVGHMLKEQYGFLKGFVADLEAGDLSQAAVQARADLYFLRSREAYETANAAAYGVPKLPAMPSDLSSECKGGCNCQWDIEQLPGTGNFDCTWTLGPHSDSCPTCLDRSIEWSPLEARNGVLLPFRMIKAEVHHHHEAMT